MENALVFSVESGSSKAEDWVELPQMTTEFQYVKMHGKCVNKINRAAMNEPWIESSHAWD